MSNCSTNNGSTAMNCLREKKCLSFPAERIQYLRSTMKKLTWSSQNSLRKEKKQRKQRRTNRLKGKMMRIERLRSICKRKAYLQASMMRSTAKAWSISSMDCPHPSHQHHFLCIQPSHTASLLSIQSMKRTTSFPSMPCLTSKKYNQFLE